MSSGQKGHASRRAEAAPGEDGLRLWTQGRAAWARISAPQLYDLELLFFHLSVERIQHHFIEPVQGSLSKTKVDLCHPFSGKIKPVLEIQLVV